MTCDDETGYDYSDIYDLIGYDVQIDCAYIDQISDRIENLSIAINS